MKKLLLTVFTIISLPVAWGQAPNDDLHSMPEYTNNSYRTIIRIPNIGEYQTMKCDLHTHSMFSDGDVWPTIRVNEAWNDGLDAIALTDHIEYRPRRKYLNADLNTSNTLAQEKADELGFLLIKGTEITRSKPEGHMNALFIQDVNKLELPTAAEAIEEAHRQGALVMLNHPGWPDGKSTMDTMHLRFMKEGKIQAIEVFNSRSFYPKVCGWVNEYNLSPAASSDAHGLINASYVRGTFRPMTLVLAKERTLDGIKEALLAKRTIAFFNQNIAGQKEWVQALFDACIEVKAVADDEKKKRHTFEVYNHSDIEFLLKTKNGTELLLRPNQAFRMNVGYAKLDETYEVANTHIGLNTHLVTCLPFAKALKK